MSALIDLFAGLGPWNWFIIGVLLMALETLVPGVHFLWFGLSAVVVDRLSEEHATVRVTTGSSPLKQGDLVRVLPNHSCVVSNLVDAVRLVDGDDAAVSGQSWLHIRASA